MVGGEVHEAAAGGLVEGFGGSGDEGADKARRGEAAGAARRWRGLLAGGAGRAVAGQRQAGQLADHRVAAEVERAGDLAAAQAGVETFPEQREAVLGPGLAGREGGVAGFGGGLARRFRSAAGRPVGLMRLGRREFVGGLRYGHEGTPARAIAPAVAG